MKDQYLGKFIFKEGVVWRISHVLHRSSTLRLEYVCRNRNNRIHLLHQRVQELEASIIFGRKIANRLIVWLGGIFYNALSTLHRKRMGVLSGKWNNHFTFRTPIQKTSNHSSLYFINATHQIKTSCGIYSNWKQQTASQRPNGKGRLD